MHRALLDPVAVDIRIVGIVSAAPIAIVSVVVAIVALPARAECQSFAMASDGSLLVNYNQQAYMMFLIRSTISNRKSPFPNGAVVWSPPAERAGPPKSQSLSLSSFPGPANVFLGSCLSFIWLSSSSIRLSLSARVLSSHLLPHSLLLCHVAARGETGLGCLDGREHGRLFHGYCGCGSDGIWTLEGALKEGRRIRILRKRGGRGSLCNPRIDFCPILLTSWRYGHYVDICSGSQSVFGFANRCLGHFVRYQKRRKEWVR